MNHPAHGHPAEPIPVVGLEAIELSELLEFVTQWLSHAGPAVAASLDARIGADGYSFELRRAAAMVGAVGEPRTDTVKAPEAPPLPEELVALLRRMRLPYLRRAAPAVCATARAQRWDPAEVLRVLLVEEVAGRDTATRRMRRKAAGFPSGKTLDTWRPADSSIPAPTQAALRTLEWVGRAENLAVTGPSGTGKSHFIEALGHAVIDAGMRVSWFSLESLTATLARAKVDASVSKVVARICRAELVVMMTLGCCRPARRRPRPSTGW